MKKSLILPITLAALMMMGGCEISSVPQVSSESDVSSWSMTPAYNSVSITNKEALTASWAVGGAARTITISVDPAIEDINEALDNGLVTITSSDTSIISVTRLLLSPKAAGKATITVTVCDKSDSVEITVKGEETAIDLYQTVHAGTQADPLDNADACKVATSVGTSKSAEYYIKGKVASWYHFPGENAAYTSWFFEAATDGGAQFECYKIASATDASAGVPLTEVFIGAEVIVKGKITTYNGQAETDTGTFVEKVSGTAPTVNTITGKTAGDAVTIGKALKDGDVTTDLYTITGYVQVASGTNYFLGTDKLGEGEKATTSDLFEIYGYDVATKGLAEGSADDEILVGSKVELTAHIKNYHGQVEGVVLDGLVKVLESGAEVEAIKATCAEAIAAGKALDPNGTSTDVYEITGYVVYRYSWSDSYGNGSVFIADDPAESNSSNEIQVYNMTDKDLHAACRKGDKITVTTTLTRYVKYDTDGTTIKKETIETAPGCKVAFNLLNRTIEETLELGAALENKSVTDYQVCTTGYIVDKGTWSDSYGNADLKVATTKGETESAKILTVFRFNDKTVYDTLAVNDYVSVTSIITKYNDTVETASGKATIVKLEAPAEEESGGSSTGEVTYQSSLLDFSGKKYGQSAYSGEWKYEDWAIFGAANNNKGWGFVKVGGKKATLEAYTAGQEVYIKTTNPMEKEASKVEITVGGGTASACYNQDNEKVSAKVVVYSDAAMTQIVDTTDAQETPAIDKGGADVVLTFNKKTEANWPANSYYKVLFDVTNTTTYNGVTCISKVEVK